MISSACSELALKNPDIELYWFNRGETEIDLKPAPHLLTGDIRNRNQVESIVKAHTFDVVVNWIAFTPQHVKQDYEVFGGRVGQYIFISSASAYQTPAMQFPITEDTPLDNPFWQYSRNKADCERFLNRRCEQNKFPVTIVRPSHTYNRKMLPIIGKYTTFARMLQNKKVFIHDRGESVWILTHHKDFAKGFNGLLGLEPAVGETVHITSDELLSWNQIYQTIAEAADVDLNGVYLPSHLINAYDSELGAGLLGDKSCSMIPDNSKIKSLVPGFGAEIPFAQGAREIVDYYLNTPQAQVLDEQFDSLTDKMISEWEAFLNIKRS
ncbi:MAG: NAD-dependent epimerase/dehydratase family protein [candidate division KSB1 bacterium]|nr:NAD-dependent epimerase/dehydratase family protein [candidate division KSB1 bacterium]